MANGGAAERENAASWVTTGPRSIPVVPVGAIAMAATVVLYITMVVDYKTGVAVAVAVHVTWVIIVLVWRWLATRAPSATRREGAAMDLASAARKGVAARCAGRIRTRSLIEAPRAGRPCAGYVVHQVLGTRASKVVSEAAPMDIETVDGELVELETRGWRLHDPFARSVRSAEATLEDGAEIVVHARVEALGDASGETYRGGSGRYRLLSGGGTIVPVLGYSTTAVYAREPSITRDVIVATVFAAVCAGSIGISRGHIYKGQPMPPADPECSASEPCANGRHCEDGRCLDAPKVATSSGGVCSHSSDCVAGLRCRFIDPEMILSSHQDPQAPPGSDRAQKHCTEGCRNDRDCPIGKLCVPCSGEKKGLYADSYDGNCFAREDLWGKLAVRCDAHHPTSAAVPSATAAPR